MFGPYIEEVEDRVTHRICKITVGLLALASASPGTAQSKATEPVVIGNPGEWFSSKNYPPEAIRVGAQGRVMARLTVDEHGTPSQCYIAVSSGNAALDSMTCSIAMLRGRFKPGRDEKGRPQISTYILPVSWRLPKEMPATDLSEGRSSLFDQEFQLAIDDTGAVKNCTVIRNDIVAKEVQADPCRDFPPGRRPFGSPVKNGKATTATVTVTTNAYMDAN